MKRGIWISYSISALGLLFFSLTQAIQHFFPNALFFYLQDGNALDVEVNVPYIICYICKFLKLF